MKLRGCLLTAAFVPRPASAHADGLPPAADLSQTFYGTDPLLGVWGSPAGGPGSPGGAPDAWSPRWWRCRPADPSPGALPLANNFGHALIGIDASSRALAVALRRAKLPGRSTYGAFATGIRRRARFRSAAA